MEKMLKAQFNALKLEVNDLDWSLVTYGCIDRGKKFDYVQGKYHVNLKNDEEEFAIEEE